MKGRTITWALIWVGVWVLVAIWMHQLVFFDSMIPGASILAAEETARNTAGLGLLKSAGLAAGITGLLWAIGRTWGNKEQLAPRQQRVYREPTYV